MAGITVARSTCGVLERYGVRTIFGIPGIHIEQMYEGIASSPGLRHILTRHEQGAAFAADGFARVTGSAGVCLVTTGPGATNTLTPLAEAYADSIPVVVLAGQIDAAMIGLEKGLLHEIRDQAAMFEPVAKRVERPRRAEDVAPAVARALADAPAGRPRPCYVELPTDLLGAADSPPDQLPEVAAAAEPDQAAVSDAARLLSRAEHPVIVAGGGVLWGEASAALVSLAERLRAPILTTVKGNGAVPHTHLLSAGCIHPTEGGGPMLLADADAVLVVASQLDDETTASWTLPLRNVVQVDVDPAEIGRNYPVAVEVAAAAEPALRAIEAELPATVRSGWDRDSARISRDLMARSLGSTRDSELSMIRGLRAMLPDETVMVSDQGIVNAWTAWFWPVLERRTQLFPWSGATLGYGLPAAVGASAGAPDRPVVVVTGDGGFMFNVAELATCAKYELNVTTIVVNNNAYGSIAESQRKAFGGDADATLLNPDFLQLAAAFGVPACRVGDLGDLPSAAAAAAAEPGPSVIEVTARIRQPWC